MGGVKIANRFGRPFPHSMERVELKDLEAGDHIVVERHNIYWHHMIVDKEEEDVYIIHYDNKTGPSGSGSGIVRNPFNPNKNDTYYRVIYKDGECLTPEKVVKTAKEIMNEGGHSYNSIFNNCEHFASQCKTGEKICHQMWTPIEILGKCSLSTILPFVVQTLRSWLSNRKYKAKCTKEFAKYGALLARIHPSLATITELIGERYPLHCDYDAFKGKYREVFADYGAQFDPRLAMIISLIGEIYLLYRDYDAAKAKYHEGEKLTEVVKVITKRVCAAVGSIVGDLIGFYYGNYKLACLGAIFGGWVSPVLLTFAAECVGDWVTKLIFAQLGELLAPLFTEYVSPLKKSQ